MPRYRIEVNLPKGSNIKTVEAGLKKPGVLPKGASAQITKDDPPSSRADRLNSAMSLVEDAVSEVNDLKDELQNWVDSMPENLQSSSKADEINDAISELEEVSGSLDQAVSGAQSVSMPGMY